jgi:hypothetical protein
MSAVWALLAGSIVSVLPLFALFLALTPLQLLPGRFGPEPGSGWPWRVGGTWAALADLGPLLLVGTAVAGGVGLYVGWRTERRTARWPLVVCAALVGWVPVGATGRPGLLGASGGFAFLAMWWTTHRTAAMPRPALPGSRRVWAALLAALCLGLAAVSWSYDALHPIRFADGVFPNAATLRGGRSDRVLLVVGNMGPLPARILGLAPVDAPGLRLARVERDGPRTSGPTIDSLFSPAGHPRLAAGGTLMLWLTFTGPIRCSPLVVRGFDVRLAVAGGEHTQRVDLTGPGRVSCAPAPAPAPAPRRARAR